MVEKFEKFWFGLVVKTETKTKGKIVKKFGNVVKNVKLEFVSFYVKVWKTFT